VPSAFLHAAILWSLDSEAFRAEQPDVAAPARASEALERIASSITAALRAFPTTVDEDATALETAPASGWLPSLLRYRMNAKQLHERAAAAIRRRASEIAVEGWHPSDVVEPDPDGRYGIATVAVAFSVPAALVGAWWSAWALLLPIVSLLGVSMLAAAVRRKRAPTDLPAVTGIYVVYFTARCCSLLARFTRPAARYWKAAPAQTKDP